MYRMYKAFAVERLCPCHHRVRNRGNLDQGDDAYLLPSGWTADGAGKHSGGGTTTTRTRGAAPKRARGLKRNQKKVRKLLVLCTACLYLPASQ